MLGHGQPETFMTLPTFITRILVGASIVTTAPASATIITTTLTGNSENIHDNANVFGFGTGQNLLNKDFVETFYTDTSAINFFGPQSNTGVSSNSIFGGSPPYAVAATLTINGHTFSTIGSNFSSLYTQGDYQVLSNDKVNRSVDNSFYVDITGNGLPTTVSQSFSSALSLNQIANVSFIDNNSGGNVSDAIGNLFPNHLSVSTSAAGAVPEPATWAMMILGMGAIGFTMRRRRSITTTVSYAV